MRQRPDIPDGELIDALRRGFALPVSAVDFLALGEDDAAAVYRAEGQGGPGAGGPWFVKLKSSSPGAGALVPRFLADRGFEAVIAPLRATSGDVGYPLSGWTLLAYPFIDAPNAAAAGLTDDQWVAYGRLLRAVHDATPALDSDPALRDALPWETFGGAAALGWRSRADQVDAALDASPQGVAAECALVWHAQRAVLDHLLARVDILGPRLRRRGLPSVLCHADIHRYNVLVLPDGRLLFTDWDEAMLSPKERDLMFILRGVIGRPPVSPAQEALFLQGYGAAAGDVDADALAYYRCLWAVQDAILYAARVVLTPGLDDETRRAALDTLRGLFAPGDEVEAALTS